MSVVPYLLPYSDWGTLDRQFLIIFGPSPASPREGLWGPWGPNSVTGPPASGICPLFAPFCSSWMLSRSVWAIIGLENGILADSATTGEDRTTLSRLWWFFATAMRVIGDIVAAAKNVTYRA